MHRVVFYQTVPDGQKIIATVTYSGGKLSTTGNVNCRNELLRGVPRDGLGIINAMRNAPLMYNGRYLRATYQETQDKSDTEARRLDQWKAIDGIARAWEDRFMEAADEMFENEMRGILALLRQAEKKSLQEKASINWTILVGWIFDFMANAKDRWRELFIPLLQGVITDQGNRWEAQLGIEFDVHNIFAEQSFQTYVATFSDPFSDTTSKEIGELIKGGIEEGLGVPQVQERIVNLFTQWRSGKYKPPAPEFEWLGKRLPPYRTEMIARTETMRASNFGTWEMFRRRGIKKKEWLGTPDDRIRDTHMEACQVYGDADMAQGVTATTK
jgi:hypothetical protein